MLTNELTLVGRFGGRKISAEDIHRWVTDSWLPLISHYPKVFIRPSGWLAFKFHKGEDLDIILKGFWKWDNLGLFLKRWTPLFHPVTLKGTTLFLFGLNCLICLSRFGLWISLGCWAIPLGLFLRPMCRF